MEKQAKKRRTQKRQAKRSAKAKQRIGKSAKKRYITIFGKRATHKQIERMLFGG